MPDGNLQIEEHGAAHIEHGVDVRAPCDNALSEHFNVEAQRLRFGGRIHELQDVCGLGAEKQMVRVRVRQLLTGPVLIDDNTHPRIVPVPI